MVKRLGRTENWGSSEMVKCLLLVSRHSQIPSQLLTLAAASTYALTCMHSLKTDWGAGKLAQWVAKRLLSSLTTWDSQNPHDRRFETALAGNVLSASPACACVCIICVTHVPCGSQGRGQVPWSYRMSPGNQTHVLCKNSKCSFNHWPFLQTSTPFWDWFLLL